MINNKNVPTAHYDCGGKRFINLRNLNEKKFTVYLKIVKLEIRKLSHHPGIITLPLEPALDNMEIHFCRCTSLWKKSCN